MTFTYTNLQNCAMGTKKQMVIRAKIYIPYSLVYSDQQAIMNTHFMLWGMMMKTMIKITATTRLQVIKVVSGE